MKREKKIIFLCHCILNCNSKVEGLALYEGALNKILKYLIDEGYGIIQLPCPEVTFYGIKRWGHVKEQFDTPYFRNHCKEIFMPYLNQIRHYIKNDYRIDGIIGIDGSPSCGVNKTCSSLKWGGEVGCEFGIDEKINDLKMVKGKGVFIEEIEKLLKEYNLNIKFFCIDEEDMYTEDKLIKLLENN
ncbi:Predicted secreted protein [Caloramator quimbayensis]|uniref:Predicted secreted protein n=1 Tax=Caloramator quimbayensis TaxID=1147123 RepID=A0A1T4WFW2_9CLOT|nr:CD3072 family TudS-related putative desulfidase [Caloramator quimbayensis]SKA75785.1 Predicted secreted protein [Caloramator quimbayensis]